MTTLTTLERRLRAIEEDRARQLFEDSPEARRLALDAAVADCTATLDEYAEFLGSETDDCRVDLLAATPLWVACRGSGIFVDNPVAALAFHPDERLSDGAQDWVVCVRALATSDYSKPRRPPTDHPHWDRRYSVEGRLTFALMTLALGEGDEALEIRREAWIRDDGEGWKLASAVVEASEQTGPTAAELEAWRGPQGFLRFLGDVWTGADCVEPAEPDGDEPEEWVSYASLARSVADLTGRGPDRLR